MFSNYEKLSYTQNFNDTKTDDVSELRAQNQNEKKKKSNTKKVLTCQCEVLYL